MWYSRWLTSYAAARTSTTERCSKREEQASLWGQGRLLETGPEVSAFTLNTEPYTVGVFVLTLKLKKIRLM